ncbi:amino acid adenylation domain-containing protein [uncultured Chitinophaga sp.]|jgi:amino acid adenylation domain|uniref:non-ribosomal peptide synthetase n=1 Tax=uncultured Chitinophaga sp. TaxID=339340 RepID=UPI002615ED72|nr:amino acid adenylation domain-containing protein [uncultured Chitinophaga sp.]
MTVAVLLEELVHNHVKLSVKDGKLLCQLPEGGIDSDLLNRLKEHKEEIKELLRQTNSSRQKRPAIQRRSSNAPGALSYGQQRLWILDQIEGSAHYNISNALLLEGTLDIDVLQRTFHTIVERHEILRTSYTLSESGDVQQLVQPAAHFTIQQDDLSELDATAQAAGIQQLQAAESKAGFNLQQDVLLRVRLVKTGATAFVLLVTMHHIATDGWSIGVLIKEFCALYTAYCQGQENPLPELTIQYADYAQWQQEWLKGEVLEELKSYWSAQLSNLPPVHSLPLDRPRPVIQTFAGNTIYSKIDADTLHQLKAICDKEGATLFAGLYAVFTVLLARYSNENDIVVGTPIANREQPEVAGLIGFFVNMLVLRSQVSVTGSFIELIRQTRQMLFDAYAHQQMPFDMLVSELQPERNAAYSALFQVMFVLQNNEKAAVKLPGLSLRPMEQSRPFAQYDLSLHADENSHGLSLSWEYNTDIFELSTIQRMASHFENLLGALVHAPQAAVLKADILAGNELQQVLSDFNQTARAYPQQQTILDLFAEQVKERPEQVALKFRDRSYTYAELDRISGQLAAYLVEHYSIANNDLVGIQLERSERMLPVIIAILKSGAAYMPIGVDYPAERVAYILEDAQPRVLVNEEELSRFFTLQDQYDTAPLLVTPSGNDIAYCIYTSGSTGTPKGVLNQHDGLYNRLVWMKEYLQVTPGDVFLQKTPYTFDVSVWELFLPLISGATVVFAVPDGHKDPFYLQSLVEAEKVSIIHFVPSMLNIFLSSLEQGACSSLQHIVCSGEALPAKVVKACRQQQGSRIHNLYGPTEAAIDVTAVDLTDAAIDTQGVSIGYPVANTSIYIVNAAMALQPVGIPGELLIGGIQVARGYLNKPALSSEKFIADPFKPGGRVYRTGDIAKWNSDGSITYIGRRDGQVKIRGHRIELGEVSAQLLLKPAIREAVVTVSRRNDQEPELVAYVVSDEQEDATTLRSYLATKLPDFEIPAYFIQLEALPLSANGKVDEKALPDPVSSTLKTSIAYVAPRNEKEQLLTAIFAKELGRSPAEIGINDNFFDLGANSIKLIRILQEIRKTFNVDIKPVLLFQYTTIKALVALFEESQKETTAVDDAFVAADMDDMIDSF